MVWLHCISLFMVPESIFLRDNNVGRYFSFVMWRPKKKIKIDPFVPPSRRPGCGSRRTVVGHTLPFHLPWPDVSPSRRQGSTLVRLLAPPQTSNYLSLFSSFIPRLPTQPTTIRASQYPPFLGLVSVPPVASMLGSLSLSPLSVSRSNRL